MPRRNRFNLKALLPLGLLVVAAFALVRRGGDDWEYEQAELVTEEAPEVLHVTRRRPAARFAPQPLSRCCSSPEPRSPRAPGTRWHDCWTRTPPR